LLDESVDVLDREVTRQHFPRPRRTKVVGGVHREPAIDDQETEEAAIAGDRASDGSRRAPFGHQVAHVALEVGSRERLEGGPSLVSEIGQTVEIAGITVDGIAGQPPLDGQMSDVRVKRGCTAQGTGRLLPFDEALY